MSDLVERLRAALEFYADPGSFTKDVPDFYSELDFGAQAQDAIAIITALEGERDTAARALGEMRAALEDVQWDVISRALDRYNAGETSDLVALGIIGQGVLLLDEKRRAALSKTEGKG